MKAQSFNNAQLNGIVCERLESAYNAGLKLTALSRMIDGVSTWRIRSVACCGDLSPYPYASTFTDDECLRIIKALDDINESI